jgi:elongation factor G
MAGIFAVREALEKADSVLLEPIMRLEINTPEEFFGDIVGDINGRRGQIVDTEHRGTTLVIRALVPLAETFGYATAMRSLTQGRATYSMEFDHYAEVPHGVAEKLTGGRVRKPVRA